MGPNLARGWPPVAPIDGGGRMTKSNTIAAQVGGVFGRGRGAPLTTLRRQGLLIALGMVLAMGPETNAQEPRIVLSVDSELVTFAETENSFTHRLTLTADPPFVSDTTVNVACTSVIANAADVVIPAAQAQVVVPDFVCKILNSATCFAPSYTVTFSGTVEADDTIAVQSATMLVRDDPGEYPQYQLHVEPARISESSGERDFSVSAERIGGEKRCTPATVETFGVEVDETPQPGAVDFTVSNRQLTFGANETGTFSVTPENDDENERDRQVAISGVAELRGGIPPRAREVVDLLATQFVIEDDDPDMPRVSVADAEAVEGGGSLAFVVTLDPAVSASVTVDYATADGTAVEGADYRAVSGTLTFEPGRKARTVPVAVIDDGVDEPTEHLTFTLTNPVNAVLDRTSAEGTIEDDDEASATISLTANPSSVSEGAGETPVTVTAVLNGSPRPRATTVAASVAGTGAPAAVDFSPVADFTITINSGETTGAATFVLEPEDDRVMEVDETLTVSGTAELPVTAASIILRDDDQTSIALTAVPDLVSEGDGATAVTVTAAVVGPLLREPASVTVTVAGSGDPDAVDFRPVPDFSITLPAAALRATGTFTLVPVDDEVVETNETLEVSGTSPLVVRSTTVTLADDDSPSTAIALSVAPHEASESEGPVEVAVTATLDGSARTVPTRVAVSVAGTGAPGRVGFEPVEGFEIVIPAAARTGTSTFTLIPEDDATQEFDETLSVAGESELPVVPASIILRDDDQTSIALTAVPDLVSEGDGATAVTVTAAVVGPLLREPASVTVTVAGSGDPDAVDFRPVPDFSITLPAAALRATGTFTLVPVDDEVVETNETLEVSGTSPVVVRSTTVTLADDDPPSTAIALSVAPHEASESEGPVEVAVTATLDGSARTVPTRVAVSVAGTGAPGRVGFEPVEGFEIVIPAAARTGTSTFTLIPEDDATQEFDETLSVAGESELPVVPASIILRDDDQTSIALTAVPDLVSEGDGATAVTVTAAVVGPLLREPASVTVTVAGSGDPDAVDFRPVPDFSITLPAAALRATGTFTLVPVDDEVVETNETLEVSGTSPLVVRSTTVTLADDDPPSTAIALSVAPHEASESEGPVEVAVTATLDRSARTVPTRVAVSVAGTGAPGRVGFEPVEGFEIVIPAAARTGTSTFTLIPEDDATQEFDETLSVAGESELPVVPASIVLRDDDRPSLSLVGATAREDDGELVFDAVLGEPSLLEVAVRYATADGTARTGDDYAEATGKLVIAPGALAARIVVDLIDDDVAEDVETFAVMLSEPVNVTLATASVTGTITDDDPLPELGVEGGSASEGGTVVFAVTLAGATDQTVTVDYATADGAATAGADYGSVSGMLTFAPGESSATVLVDIVDDEAYELDETFFARLSSPVNAVIGNGEAKGTIFDDDEQPATVAVRPENPMLCVGGAPARIDLSRYFSGTGLRYSVSAPDPSVATASLDGAVLILAPGIEGTTSVTVTAANMGSRATFELAITVVADPAELAAIERGLAVAGGMILADMVDAIGDRFVIADGSNRGSSAPPPPPRALAGRNAGDLFAADWGANPGGFAAREAWPPAGALDNMPLASGSLAFSATPGGGIGSWSVWGRGGTRRFGDGEVLEDGSLVALQLGADVRVRDWLIGAAAGLARTDAEYRFMRSVDACGGGGEGEGVLETEILSIHPYVGRRVGRGWLWGTAGVGGGETIVERCASGHRTAVDLSTRMGALGGRHLIRSDHRVEISLVEDVGVVRATTETAVGPAGDHDVSVGRARLGLEVRGVCATGAGIVGWIRAFARRDWGDGIEGSGAEVAIGARLDAPEKRVRLEASMHAVAAHTWDEYEERGANVAAAYLSRPDGTGLQASMTLRRGAPGEVSRLGESWELSRGPRVARRGMRGDVSVGFGFRAPRGLARPFAAVGKSDQGSSVAAGLRYEALGGPLRFVGEFSIGHRRGVGDGRFVTARFVTRR